MKRQLILTLVGFFCAALFMGSGDARTSHAAGPVILKGGLVAPTGTSQVKTLENWAAKVKEKTNGSVIIEIYPSEQLGNERSLLENTNLGVIDWTLVGPSGAESFTPEFGMFENAYTFQSTDHIKNSVMNIEFLTYLNDLLAKKSNVKLLGFQWFGSRHVIADKPILSPKDGEGLLMRTPQVPAYKVACYALGTTATPMAYGEVYMGLSQGVVNAAECPLENINVMKWYEVKKEVTLTAHVEGMTSVFMNRASFEKKLSPEQQKVVFESGMEAWSEHFEAYLAKEQSFAKILEDKGVHISVPSKEQKAVFIKRAHEKLAEEYIPKWGETWVMFQNYAN